MVSRNERNHAVIEEFRSNKGTVGSFGGGALLLLSTTGAKTGQRRTNPLACLQDGDRWLVFASKGGGPTNPDWYHNLVANRMVTVEVGTEVFEGDAVVLRGAERDRLFAQQAELHPQFGEYQRNTKRTIPVVALTRRNKA